MTLCETPQETPVFRCVVVALGGCAQHLAGGGPSEWVQILSVTNCLLLSPVTVIKRTQSAHVTTTVAQSLSFCYVMIAYLCILFIDLKKIQKHSSHYETIVIETIIPHWLTITQDSNTADRQYSVQQQIYICQHPITLYYLQMCNYVPHLSYAETRCTISIHLHRSLCCGDK